MLNLAGNQGTTLANESVEAVHKVIDHHPAPPGVQAYVTGPAALSDDMHLIGNASLAKITLFTLGAIAIKLLLVYRSIVTTLIQLFMTGTSSPCWRSRPEPTTGSSWSAAIRRRCGPARTEKPPTTPPFAGWPRWCWARA